MLNACADTLKHMLIVQLLPKFQKKRHSFIGTGYISFVKYIKTNNKILKIKSIILS